jgi:predicted metalloendopeptidase
MPSVGMKVNGALTTGENIADMGGLKQAYKAWKKQSAGQSDPAIAGLTGDQLLFVGFAQAWCTKATPETEKLRLTTDSHSPPRYRVNGPVSNNPDFAAAFQCKAGTPMNPDKKCTVW